MIDILLFISCIIILLSGVIITIKTRFVQFRMLPEMLRLLFSSSGSQKDEKSTVRSHRALFTAMSTTLGISTIVSPVIAIRLGGPGAVVGFLLATILGTAVNFVEVTLALSYRKRHQEMVFGGPMQYLQDGIHRNLARLYAFFGFLLLMAWSGAQSNQLASILSSPMLGHFRISPYITGGVLAVIVTFILLGGIQRIATISAKLVPLMFLLYVGSGLWIVCANWEKLPDLFSLIFKSCFSPIPLATGATVGGIVAALRWGVFKGLQSNEAGVGTQTIPHSLAQTEHATDQGVLSMVSTYCAGFVCILSSLIALVTETWLDPSLSLGIQMVVASFQMYFSSIGVAVVSFSAFLFAFGTILGNSFNGSQCFGYLTKNRYLTFFYIAAALLIFWGSITDVSLVWSWVDVLLVPVAVPHVLSVVYLAFRRKDLLQKSSTLPEAQQSLG